MYHMKYFLAKLAMLLLFIIAFSCAWVAFTAVFEISLWNIILGILSVYFILQALELADYVNQVGRYAPPEEEPEEETPAPRNPRPRRDTYEEEPEEEEEESGEDEPDMDNFIDESVPE